MPSISESGGSLQNSYGLISVRTYGVVAGATAVVSNSGTITDVAGAAVYLKAGGFVSNNNFGSIAGYNGVLVTDGPGSVTNGGTISGSGKDAVSFGIGGTLVNNGLVSGAFYGLAAFYGGAAVTNLGTISGGGAGTGMFFGAVARARRRRRRTDFRRPRWRRLRLDDGHHAHEPGHHFRWICRRLF